jgi:hypothetical protein
MTQETRRQVETTEYGQYCRELQALVERRCDEAGIYFDKTGCTVEFPAPWSAYGRMDPTNSYDIYLGPEGIVYEWFSISDQGKEVMENRLEWHVIGGAFVHCKQKLSTTNKKTCVTTSTERPTPNAAAFLNIKGALEFPNARFRPRQIDREKYSLVLHIRE